MRRTGPGRFEATANDMVGTVQGEAGGRGVPLDLDLGAASGQSADQRRMDQWWYLQDDGSMLNRTIITKLGIVVAEVTEHFVRTP